MNTLSRQSKPFNHLVALLLLLSLTGLQGCASVYKPHNTKITQVDNSKGYRLLSLNGHDYGDHMIFLAFSGGGTRAAALSYGVLQELRDTPIRSRGQQVRLLDEVDGISSVSGGSFTAAYYGLYGDGLFSDYEKDFLRQSVQGTLIRKLFDPTYWWKTVFSGFDRTEMAIEYYDNHIFKGKTFADFPRGKGPYIEINATDLGGGNRFSFSQGFFDLICSDLDQFSVARAVTASSAVPIAFPTVVLKNHTGDCDPRQSLLYKTIKDQNEQDPRARELKKRAFSYLSREKRPYVHLVDGGISDNLGLRALIERVEMLGPSHFLEKNKVLPKDALVILVNAQVKPERGIDLSASKPSVVDTIDAFSDTQMTLFNEETRLLLDNKLKDLAEQIKGRGINMTFYTGEVSFESVEDKTLKSYLNNLPTSLELSSGDVDMLIDVGRKLLRSVKGYRDFLANNAENTPIASTSRPQVVQAGVKAQ